MTLREDLRGSVVVADDDVLLREGITSLLKQSGFDVVGQAGDAAGLLALVREHVPDLAVIDIRMPPTRRTEGLEAAREIRRVFPGVAMMLLSAYVEVEHAMELLASGERVGYLLKDRVLDIDEFLEAWLRWRRTASWGTSSRTGSPMWARSSTRSNGS